MAEKTKAPILPILIIIILISLSLGGTTFYLLQKEKANNLVLRQQLEDLNAKLNIYGAELGESKKTISHLELKLGETQTQIETLNSQLDQEKTAKQEAITQIGQLKADLEQQKKLRSELETQVSKAQDDMKKIQGQLNVLESKKGELETKIRDLEAQAQSQAQAQTPAQAGQSQEVKLGTIVITPEGTPPTQAPAGTEVSSESALKGKILVVNKDYNFVVINLGNRDGVKTGDIFSIYHDDNYIGDTKIEKVHDSMSAANIEPISMKDKISEGDKVVQKTK